MALPLRGWGTAGRAVMCQVPGASSPRPAFSAAVPPPSCRPPAQPSGISCEQFFLRHPLLHFSQP